MRGGRPLRFLAILLCGWTSGRAIDLYRRGGVDALQRIVPGATLAKALGIAPAAAALAPRFAIVRDHSRAPDPIVVRKAEVGSPSAAKPVAEHGEADDHRSPTAPVPAPLLSPAIRPPSIARSGSRLSGSAWLIARDGGGASLPGSQLGASQAGVRLLYALGSARRVALSTRLSAPLSGRGREAAIGVDWQPTHAPVHLLAEQRIALDGGPSGPMLGVVGGFGPADVAPGLRLEAYGQAGVVARAGGGAFADGALRASHPIAAAGSLRVDIGAGIWGGAQRGASRLDVGPSLGIVAPFGSRSIRLAADWRQRVAGSARPGSGPALSIGTNF